VTGVLLVCAIGGGLIWHKWWRDEGTDRKRPCDVYARRASYVSVRMQK